MKKKKNTEKKELEQQKKESFVTKIFKFFDEYNKIIYGVTIGLLLLVCALLALNKFYITPQNEKASALMTAPMETMMKGDSLSLIIALEGDDDNEGFLAITSSFGFTSTSNTAKYLAGLCYIKLNEPDEALRYLLKFKHKENVFWYAAQGLISDLFDDQGDLKKAIKYAKKAAASKDPYFAPLNLFKLGQLYEREEDWKNAVASYQTIQDKFYAEFQTMGVEKYLEKALINKNK